jgi:hypothetical protein
MSEHLSHFFPIRQPLFVSHRLLAFGFVLATKRGMLQQE